MQETFGTMSPLNTGINLLRSKNINIDSFQTFITF